MKTISLLINLRSFKKTLLILLFLPLLSFSQLSLSNTYTDALSYVKLKSGDYYWSFKSPIITFYNVSDNSLYKTIVVPTISGYALPSYPYNISSKLFNDDDLIEYYIYTTSIGGSSTNNNIARVINENGLF